MFSYSTNSNCTSFIALIYKMMMMMIDVLRPRLCTWWAKWAERPPKVMKRSQRWNTLQICQCRDSNTGGNDLWPNTLPVRPWRHPTLIYEINANISLAWIIFSGVSHLLKSHQSEWVSSIFSLSTGYTWDMWLMDTCLRKPMTNTGNGQIQNLTSRFPAVFDQQAQLN